MNELSTPEANYLPYKKVDESNPWDLLLEPTTKNRYDPRTFHVGMFNYWTNKVCTEHKHKL